MIKEELWDALWWCLHKYIPYDDGDDIDKEFYNKVCKLLDHPQQTLGLTCYCDKKSYEVKDE